MGFPCSLTLIGWKAVSLLSQTWMHNREYTRMGHKDYNIACCSYLNYSKQSWFLWDMRIHRINIFLNAQLEIVRLGENVTNWIPVSFDNFGGSYYSSSLIWYEIILSYYNETFDFLETYEWSTSCIREPHFGIKPQIVSVYVSAESYASFTCIISITCIWKKNIW